MSVLEEGWDPPRPPNFLKLKMDPFLKNGSIFENFAQGVLGGSQPGF
jgi:hypothetical protein